MNINNHAIPRNGETTQRSVRSDRFFEQESYWYFRTREGLDIGPFDTESEAKAGLNGFIGFLQQAKSDVVTRITKYVTLQTRKNDIQEIPSRTHRLFEQNNYWYFRTREGMDIGPFDSRGCAAVGAKGFVAFIEESTPDVVDRVTDYIRIA